MAEFLMPSLGADMETGKVVEWLVKPGDRVKSGDVVAVVETHKGAIDVEIFLDGVIGELVPLNEALPVGAMLAQVTASGAPVAPSAKDGSSPPSTGSAMPGKGSPAGRDVRADVERAAFSPAPSAVAAPARPTLPVASAPARIRVSPAARLLAKKLGLDPATLHGNGVDGSVVLADVEGAVSAAQSQAPAVSDVAPRARAAGFDAAQMRQAIAAAMSRSKREIPHYYLSETIDFTSAAAWLEEWNRDRPPEQRVLSAVLLLKATALGLREVPQLNGFFENGVFRSGQGIHIGWAIALRGGGLVAPALHDADKKSLPELMIALRDLVQRARAGGLRSSELTDPTTTVTNLGDRGAESVFGVIYPPQVAILGFGRIVQRPWVVDDAVVARQIVSATLAGDHRASDGHLGGQLLAAINRALQSPANL